MAEKTWDVLSLRDSDGAPYLANCTLLVGETAVVFKDGVSEVPERIVSLLANNKQVRIPGWTGVPEPVAAAAAPTLETGESEPDAAELVAEHLRQEAEILGAQQPRETVTADGQPRCQALKGDGSQCSNAAVDGNACGLGAHRSQVA